MPKEDVINIQVTRHELRLLVIAAKMVNLSKFIHDKDRQAIRELGHKFLKLTAE